MKKINLLSAIKSLVAGIKVKKYVVLISFELICLTAFTNPPLVSKQQIGMYKNSKTCVVLENANLSYNMIIKDAVQKYWKATEFQFIDEQEFEKRRSDSKYSFLVLMKGVFDKDPGGISYNYLSLVLGDVASNMTKMPEICSIPISYTDDNSADYVYAIPSIIKFMQIHAKNLEERRSFILFQGFTFYNGVSDFKNKVLLLNSETLASEVNSSEIIKVVYPHYFKLLSAKDIQAELATNPANTLFNFHVGPTTNTGSGKCFEMIFDVEGNLYYYHSRKITNVDEDGFNLKDFRRIR